MIYCMLDIGLKVKQMAKALKAPNACSLFTLGYHQNPLKANTSLDVQCDDQLKLMTGCVDCCSVDQTYKRFTLRPSSYNKYNVSSE